MQYSTNNFNLKHNTDLKKFNKILFTILSFFLLQSIFAQEYNYIHYTAKDGLASNTVYGVVQDNDGYIYFATDNGISRFDGKEWRTFTVKDGLPDNEVLILQRDYQDRIWAFTFSNKICYLKKGVVHNRSNDSLVKQLFLTNQIPQILSNKSFKSVYFLSSKERCRIDEQNRVIKLNDTYNIKNELSAFYFDKKKHAFMLLVNDSLFDISSLNDKFIFIDANDSIAKIYKTLMFTSNRTSITKNINQYIETAKVDYRFGCTDTPIILHPANDGCFYYDCIKNEFDILQKNKVNGIPLIDKEQNFWLPCLNDGIYKLPSRFIKVYLQSTVEKEIVCIDKIDNYISCGLNYGRSYSLKNNRNIFSTYQKYITQSKNNNNINKLVSILPINNKGYGFYGFDGFLLKLAKETPIINYQIVRTKSLEKIDEGNILVATANGVYKVASTSLKIVDTIYFQRSTYANYFNNNYYVGTLSGLYKVSPQKQQTFLGYQHPILSRRITCIKYKNDKLVVATADSGVAIMQNDKVIKTISEASGLSSNIVKTLHIKSNYLWIGTIKGVNKIDLDNYKIVARYSTSDGLPSDIINAIYIDTDSTIWIGSPEGLTSFKEKDIISTSMCNLVVENIEVSNKKIKLDSSNFVLKYNDNIKFNFVGISFRSGDEIVYHYKLEGLDASYNTTTERLLSYPSLPHGVYTLQLYATNKFGVQSKVYKCVFTVKPPFWKIWWFYLLEITIIIVIIWFIFYTRFKRKQKEYRRVADFKVQLANMEQQALQAQMNPHFIFNCLNSIQQFILSKENDKAFSYLLLFSSLVRNTLDNSEKQYISLTEELEYLQQYLAMEDLRFGEQFDYKITVDKNIISSDVKMPSMILQPFIENALRHGIRQLQNKKGQLKIDFIKENSAIICTVEDNGIGRKAAQLLKSSMHIAYQSKGMELTHRRINLLNTNKENKIEYTIIDMQNENGEATGTKVIFNIPLLQL